MKKAAISILLALLAAATSRGQEIKPRFEVVIDGGWIQVRNDKREPLVRFKTEQWATALNRTLPVTRDDRRHFALNAVAAFIAGGGGREHSIGPREQIVTLDEARKSGSLPTMTVEQGTGFIILRDTEPKAEIYRAQIIMIPPDAIKAAPKLTGLFRAERLGHP